MDNIASVRASGVVEKSTMLTRPSRPRGNPSVERQCKTNKKSSLTSTSSPWMHTDKPPLFRANSRFSSGCATESQASSTSFTMRAVPNLAAVHNCRVKLASAAESIETRLSANSEDAKRNADPVGSTNRQDLDDASKMHAFKAHLESLGRPWRSWYLRSVVCDTEAVRSLSSTRSPTRAQTLLTTSRNCRRCFSVLDPL